VRRFAYRIIKDDNFENIILLAIIVSSLKLVFDTYVKSDSTDTSMITFVSDLIDRSFTVFFAIEATLKALALGFVLNDGSYLRESWSQLDFFIVCASIVDMAFSDIDLSFIRILRLLRTLRPLRFISHNKSMKLVVTALLESVSGIFNVLIVVLLIWMMFGIFGVSLMKGKTKYCKHPDLPDYYGVSNIKVT
jgi:hypothetical protein